MALCKGHCRDETGLNPLVPVKANLNGTAYRFIQDSYVLQILWHQFGEGPYMDVQILLAIECFIINCSEQ